MPNQTLNANLQDEEAELLAELERIKKERAAEAARKAAEEAASAEASAKDELIRGNPLILGGAAPFQVRVARVYYVCPLCPMPVDVKNRVRSQVLSMGVSFCFLVPHSREVSQRHFSSPG